MRKDKITLQKPFIALSLINSLKLHAINFSHIINVNGSLLKSKQFIMNWTSISTVAFVTLLIIVLLLTFAALFLPALYQSVTFYDILRARLPSGR
jgi:hypothetical protein